MSQPASTRSAIALVIGIGAYRPAGGIPPLPCAVRDAEEVAKVLADPAFGRFPPDQVKLLLDEAATREEIVTWLSDKLPARARAAELAVIYFAGHGMLRTGHPPEGYLIPVDWDGQPGKLAAQAIPMRDVARWIGAMEADAVVLILDCCHAAHVGVREREASSSGAEREIRLPPAALRDLPEFKGKGRYLLASCDEDETSLEMDGLNHGLFTFHLLRGLQSEAPADDQGRVGLDGLFDYLKRAVSGDAARRNKRQTPWRSFAGGGDVILAVRGQRQAAAGLPPEYARLEALWADEGAAAAITDIEGRLETADESFLLAALRLLAEKAEPLGTYIIFRSLPHPSEKVKRYAHKALREIGWPKTTDAVRAIAQQREAVRIDALLDGLNALAAHPEPLKVLELLVDLRLPAAQQLRAIELANNKRMRLREDEVAALFRDLGSRYVIRRALGQGALTMAYLAHHERLQRDFVVRVLQERYADLLDVRMRFLDLSSWAAGFREGSVLRTLDLEVHSEQKIYFAVRDFVEGLTLREVLEGGTRFEPLQCLRILRKLAEALADVHRSPAGGATRPHGGVKPSNVFVTRDNRVVLGDPAVLLSAELLGAGSRLAYDALYLAPEVFGAGAGPAADLYALGCIAYELFCGRPPFVADDAMEVLIMHRLYPPPRLSLQGSSGDDRVDELLMRLLEKDPSRRYPSAEALQEAIEELERWLRSPRPPKGGEPPPRLPGPDRPPTDTRVSDTGAGLAALLSSRRFGELEGHRSGVNLEALPYITNKPSVDDSCPTGDLPSSEGGGPLPAADREFPKQIGRYEVKRLLGAGGMGEVFLAFDADLQREVAIKVLRQLSAMDAERQVRFRREAMMAAQVQHPTICPVYEVGIQEGCPYIVMRYIPGISLRELTRDLPLPPHRAAAIVRAVAQGMATAHRARIIHRDLKPGNIIIEADDRPVIVDFGLALSLNEKMERVTQEGQMMGTVGYMAPEQARGEISQLGPRTDIYSLGATFYEVLTGVPPIQWSHPAEFFYRLMYETPVPLRAHRADLGPDLEAICLRALAKDPADRYATMDELAADLDHFLQGKPVTARAVGFFGRTIRRLRRFWRRR